MNPATINQLKSCIGPGEKIRTRQLDQFLEGTYVVPMNEKMSPGIDVLGTASIAIIVYLTLIMGTNAVTHILYHRGVHI